MRHIFHRPSVITLAKLADTTPGTMADDLGCLAAMASLSFVAWFLLVLA